MDLAHDVARQPMLKLTRLLSETKRVVQVTWSEGVEEVQDFALSKRMRQEEQVEVRFG